MIVVFRVDASLEIGTGHVMRCLTLADEMREGGDEIVFICREHDGNLIGFVEEKGYQVFKLNKFNHQDTAIKNDLYHADWLGVSQSQDARDCISILQAQSINPDWLIVDHYAIDHKWQISLNSFCKKLMVIDDLADRKHHCDLLLDQTFGREKEDYFSLVPDSCRILVGSSYALLRPEFSNWREYSLKRREEPKLKKILITLGGVDQDNITHEILEALNKCYLPKDVKITVVMGKTAPYLEQVKQLAINMPCETIVKVGVENMAEIMANSDLAIGAAGATTWERCCLGLPTILLVLARNQQAAALFLEAEEVVKLLPKGGQIEPLLVQYFRNIKDNPDSLRIMAMHSIKVTDGNGRISVVASLNELLT